ncbi:MAG: type I-E CRISPR-associated protein Cas6/Cse3/CasE [Candidatus Endonucleobacter sp. (ex Gigantidas childressi)]|nr:type I-E CRISPR-associated protein Cas6/Cse3/CasE [Candidatus Endonucleobacter sp. (ex Gigantidas childressi)]
MYLSRIQLTDAIAGYTQLGLLLKDRSYGMHRILCDLFEKGERFLYREERSKEQGIAQKGAVRNLPVYYVLSTDAPDQESPLFDVATKPFQPVLKAGEQLCFKLRANPTIARRQEGKKHSSKHDVLMDAQIHWMTNACIERQLTLAGSKKALRQNLLCHKDFSTREGHHDLKRQLDRAIDEGATQWLVKRGEANGFTIDSLQTTGYQWRALPEKGRSAGFSSLDYEGVLTVSDPQLLCDMLKKGIGPSKAFGCGLMMVKRV